jgi:hypothetical protein
MCGNSGTGANACHAAPADPGEPVFAATAHPDDDHLGRVVPDHERVEDTDDRSQHERRIQHPQHWISPVRRGVVARGQRDRDLVVARKLCAANRRRLRHPHVRLRAGNRGELRISMSLRANERRRAQQDERGTDGKRTHAQEPQDRRRRQRKLVQALSAPRSVAPVTRIPFFE